MFVTNQVDNFTGTILSAKSSYVSLIKKHCIHPAATRGISSSFSKEDGIF
jgi:hypothetical protein